MRIGFDGRCIQDHFPGIGRYAYNLIEAMTRLDREDTFTVFEAEGAVNSRFDLSALAERANVQLVPVSCSYFGIKQHVIMPRLAHQFGFELYHSPYYMRPLNMPCSVVTTLHDIIPLVVQDAEPNVMKKSIYRQCVRTALKRSQEIIVDSAATQRDVLAQFGVTKNKITIIPLAADVATDDAPERLARPASIERPFVLAVGTNKPHKGLGDLVKAWQTLPSSLRDAYQLVLAGPRLPGESALPSGEATNSIVETGAVSEAILDWLYEHAELFVFPSYYEGFGLPVLEAMIHSTPVLARENVTSREVASDAAAYFTGDALALSIESLMLDEAQRYALAQAGRERARQFSWEETARRTLDVYRRAVITFT